MQRWPSTAPKRASRAAVIDEAAVEKQVDAALVAYFHIMDLAQGYRGHYLKDDHGAQLYGSDGKPLRSDETTRVSRGLPDRLFIPRTGANGCLWLEIKRPRVVIGGQVLQDRYRRSYEQEQFHALVRAAGDHVATVESADMALSYAIYCGYDVPVEGVTPWDDACQALYTNPRAQPSRPRKAQRHKIQRQTPWGLRP